MKENWVECELLLFVCRLVTTERYKRYIRIHCDDKFLKIYLINQVDDNVRNVCVLLRVYGLMFWILYAIFSVLSLPLSNVTH